jgi:hypothetical protein
MDNFNYEDYFTKEQEKKEIDRITKIFSKRWDKIQLLVEGGNKNG